MRRLDNEQVTEAIDAAAEALGGLDVVVANAGIATGGPLQLQPVRTWERVIEINLLGVVYTDKRGDPAPGAQPRVPAEHRIRPRQSSAAPG